MVSRPKGGNPRLHLDSERVEKQSSKQTSASVTYKLYCTFEKACELTIKTVNVHPGVNRKQRHAQLGMNG